MSLKSLADLQLLKSESLENIRINHTQNIRIGANDTIRFCVMSFRVLDNSTLATDHKPDLPFEFPSQFM